MFANPVQREKPTLKKPREYLILERRKQEEMRDEVNAMVAYNKQFDLKVCLKPGSGVTSCCSAVFVVEMLAVMLAGFFFLEGRAEGALPPPPPPPPWKMLCPPEMDHAP